MAKAVNRSINIWINGKQVNNDIKSVRSSMTKLINDQNRMTIGSKEYISQTEKIKSLRKIIDDHNNSLKTTNKRWKDNIDTWSKASIVGQVLYKNLNKLISKVEEYNKEFLNLADIQADLAKYTGLTADEIKQLDADLKKLNTRTAIEELTRLAAEAGKLGIKGRENILSFVEAADVINIALGKDLGEDAVKSMGKLSDMFGESDKYGLKVGMLKTASVINELGNNSTAAEKYLLEFTNRLAGTGQQAKISIANIAGFGSVLDQNAQQLESSSTALDKFIINMINKTEDVANAAGVPIKELRHLVETDMNQAILMVFKSLNEKGGLVDLAPLFKDLGAEGTRAAKTISVLAENYDKIIKEQDIANKAFNEGTSVIDEYNKKNNNAAAEMEKVENRLKNARIELGEKFNPVVLAAKDGTATFFEILSKLATIINENKVLLLALLATQSKYIISLTKQIYLKVKDNVLDKQKNIQTNKQIAADTKANAIKLKQIAADKSAVVVAMQKNIADQGGIATTKQLTALMTAKLSATRAITLATQAQTKAQQAANVAFRATPWGAILGIVIALGVGIKNLAAQTTVVEKSMKEFNKEVATQEAEARLLFTALKKTEQGSEDYFKILDKLKEIYPDIITNLTNEKGLLEDIEVAQQAVISSIKEKIAIEKRGAAQTEVTAKALEKQIKGLDKIKSALEKQGVGKEISKMITQSISKGIEDGNVSDVIKTLKEQFPEVDFSATKWFNGSIRTIEQIAYNLSHVSDITTAEINKIEEQYAEFINDAAENAEELAKTQAKIAAAQQAKEDEVAWKEFYEKLAKFREANRKSQLEGLDKERQQIEDHYAELIAMAKSFNSARGNAMAAELEDEKQQKIFEAEQKWFAKRIEEYQKFLQKVSDEIEKEESNSEQNQMNRYARELVTRDKYWKNILSENEKNIEALEAMQMEEGLTKEQRDEIYQTIVQLHVKTIEATDLYTQEINRILQEAQTETTEFVLSENEKQILSIQKKYSEQISITQTAIDRLEAQDKEAKADEITRLKAHLEKLKQLMAEEVAGVGTKPKDNGISDTGIGSLFNIDWKNFADDWQGNLGMMIDGLSEFANAGTSIMNSFFEKQNNEAQKELDSFLEAQDEKAEKLQWQLEQGIISQQYYDAQIAKLEQENEKKEREIKREQFRRDRKSAIAQATIQGALAVVTAFAQLGPIAGAIAAALVAATTIAQIAAIKSQPEPYYKGGYVDDEKIIRAGERGPEWIASNPLLTDPRTAPYITALDEFQKGNTSLLDNISYSVPDEYSLSRAANSISNNFVTSNSDSINNNYFSTVTESNNDKTIELLTRIGDYLTDPGNRQVVLNRNIQNEYENHEQQIKQYSSI